MSVNSSESFCGISIEDMKLYRAIAEAYPDFFSSFKEWERDSFRAGIDFALKHLKVAYESEMRETSEGVAMHMKQSLELSRDVENDLGLVFPKFVDSLKIKGGVNSGQ